MNRCLAVAVAALALTSQVCYAYPRGLSTARVLARAQDVEDTYDYVIVGGGTAGLTVADRLTEDGKTTVLVVEYGELSSSPLIQTVQGGFMGMSSPQFMYDITSVPQVNLRNRTTPVLAGKVVGGGSAVNAMMTVRGTAEDYDRWGRFFSNHSEWSWDGLLPYFKRALHFAPPDAAVARAANITYDAAFWGNTSGVYAGWPSFQFPATALHVAAFHGVPGVEFPPDSGAGEPGVYWFPTFMDPHTVARSYARTGHYDPAANRSNYHLLTGAKVTRILLEGTTATGVAFVQTPANANSSNFTATALPTVVRARKEVILSAGGIHSPQILQLSGIGPRKLLAAANITAIVDLPGVGMNFQDHPMLTAAFMYQNFSVHPSGDDMFFNATFQTWAAEVWAANRTGPFSIATGNAAAWLPFPVVSPQRHADVAAALATQDHAAQLPAGTDATVAAGYRAQMLAYATALANNGTAFYNSVLSGGATSGVLVDLHPLSRGTVHIDPADPLGAEPVVDYRALSNPLDVAVITELLRFARSSVMDNPLTAGFAPVELVPGANVTSDADWAEYIADTVSPTEFHPAGTCAMMPRELGGVVDEQLRVYGVSNLRVVDASIIPTLPGANTCQTVYAIAEKAADLIRYGPKNGV
ncbi:hypothetical protein B0T24DRAFT_562183 [Lasiosphaeria ovina]|uniref:Uncharacterized protein n=1 Tax=Lasiosphaeria ovina TaxID=92902 RepID=A0AAE0JUP4_9PEZI|nr:hypothetical protein B0T24DRAFT_562183 [Lasiosphaeria ovina]